MSEKKGSGKPEKIVENLDLKPSQLDSRASIFTLYLVLPLSLEEGALDSAKHLQKLGPSVLLAKSVFMGQQSSQLVPEGRVGPR